MHISEGVLPGWMLLTGWGLTAIGTAIGLKQLDNKKIPAAALLAAAFFVASLIHVPIGPTSVHLILNGLVGLLTGWGTFPILLVGLFLQAILFQFGGITVLGVNTFNMAFPAIIAYYLCRRLLKSNKNFTIALAGVIAAFVSIMGAGILVATELYLTGQQFKSAAELVLLAHIPVAIIESIINIFVLLFIKKSMPELLGGKE
ncbi:cobalt transporter CbiM [Desulfurobacterium indicum]|uniref:Cobalamin biosynthesis protein CbiM n=1 Tax=Desulfurobacterium indicum TaxID=1914305 RepID=A0A1R1MJ58_9BACT|nr:cobalt transporter CbiM [Desulfurobacterium indicum]OMH39845.1 cobalamin biosynthesis protein CbiM [Desulfurobacterium indicum]